MKQNMLNLGLMVYIPQAFQRFLHTPFFLGIPALPARESVDQGVRASPLTRTSRPSRGILIGTGTAV